MESCCIALSSEEAQVLSAITQNITVSSLDDPMLFALQAARASSQIPQRIQTILQNYKEHGSPTGFLLISGVPVDDDAIGQTPLNNTLHMGCRTALAKIQAVFNEYLGEMIAYEAEGFGQLFQDMVPNQALSTSQTSLGSKVELEIHTEQAFSKLRPDFVSLSCLRGDPAANTCTLHVKQILSQLTHEQQQLLRQPLWNIGIDMSFKMNGHEFMDGDVRGPMPIVYGPAEDPFLVFDQDLMVGINTEAHELRKVLVDIYHKHRYEHCLSAGEIIIVDNNRAVHGRSPFTPKFDGTDRFIIRSFVVSDLERSTYARGGTRMIAAHYS